jgi:hypothetical protein
MPRSSVELEGESIDCTKNRPVNSGGRDGVYDAIVDCIHIIAYGLQRCDAAQRKKAYYQAIFHQILTFFIVHQAAEFDAQPDH